MSLSVIEENLALNTVFLSSLFMLLLTQSSTSKHIFSPSLSQSSQSTM